MFVIQCCDLSNMNKMITVLSFPETEQGWCLVTEQLNYGIGEHENIS